MYRRDRTVERARKRPQMDTDGRGLVIKKICVHLCENPRSSADSSPGVGKTDRLAVKRKAVCGKARFFWGKRLVKRHSL
jgi:hypothetical protein